MKDTQVNDGPGIWFVYDGDCPVCQIGASLFKVRQAAGELVLLNARTETAHPLLQEINAAGLNLDDGMVIKYRDQLYHGHKALELMAVLGADDGMFNRFNRLMFRSSTMAKLGYPVMRFFRNLLLTLKGIKKIDNLGE